MSILGEEFYQQDVQVVALGLLGQLLVTRIDGCRCVGRVVETEAYLAVGDSASHGFRGRKKSNASMFGDPGFAYVYPIHSHYCFNVVTGEAGAASAVLIRAVEPIWGLPTMRKRRKVEAKLQLTRGPGRLCQAFGIDRSLDGLRLTGRRRIWFEEEPNADTQFDVKKTQRIGVTSAKDLLYRYVIRGHQFASGTKRFNA